MKYSNKSVSHFDNRGRAFGLSYFGIFSRVSLSWIVNFLHNTRIWGGGERGGDLVFPRNYHCYLVQSRVNCQNMVCRMQVKVSRMDWEAKVHQKSILSYRCCDHLRLRHCSLGSGIDDHWTWHMKQLQEVAQPQAKSSSEGDRTPKIL